MAEPVDLTGFLFGSSPAGAPAEESLAVSPSPAEEAFGQIAFNMANMTLPGLAGLSSIAGAGFDDALLGIPSNASSGSMSPALDDLPQSSFALKYAAMKRCGHFTEVDGWVHFTGDVTAECRFWTEGVLSSVVAAFGLIGNLVSIWVLSVPEMRNSFNRLLLALAIIDCLFILPGILIYTSKAFDWKADWFNYAFPVFLYPFSEIALCSSIYMTVAIAVERFFGLCRPLQRLSGRGPCSAKLYIIPVVVLAIVLNVPKFLESETVLTKAANASLSDDDEYSGPTTKIKVTDLRTDPIYITYYWMWTRLLATGAIPFLILALLNTKIYLSIRHSKQQLRILAIRSALPMAILGRSAPGVPMAELLSNCSQDSSPTHSPLLGSQNGHAYQLEPSSPDGNNKPKKGNNKKKPKKKKKAAKTSQNNNLNGGPPTATTTTAVRKGILTLHNDDSTENSSSSTSKVTASVGTSNGSPRMVNGQARPITRSVSAFEPAAAAVRRTHIKIKNQFSRSNSSATTSTSTTSGGGPQEAQLQQQQQASSVNPPPGPMVVDTKLVPILFGVVIVFVLCNSLRVILNIYDFSVVDDIIECEKARVGRIPPHWILCSISVSHFLLMVNSSVNFLVYCVAGTRFRRILAAKIRAVVKRLIACFNREQQQQNSAADIINGGLDFKTHNGHPHHHQLRNRRSEDALSRASPQIRRMRVQKASLSAPLPLPHHRSTEENVTVRSKKFLRRDLSFDEEDEFLEPQQQQQGGGGGGTRI